MNQIFNPDNPVMRFLSKFCDLMLLNILFLLTSVPIFTIGASTAAMYKITLQIVTNDDPYIIKGYFKAFRENFKQATLIWIPILFVLIFFAVDLYVVYNIIDPSYSYLQFPIWIIMFVILSIIIYAFPLIGRYETTSKHILKNSVLLSVANMPVTIMIIAIHVGIAYLASLSAKALIITISILLFFGFSAIAFFNSLFLIRIFFKCNPEEATLLQNHDNDNLDETSSN